MGRTQEYPGSHCPEYYYRLKERRIQRSDPSTMKRNKDIASEIPKYGYRRVWALLRNSSIVVNRKIVRTVVKDSNLSLSASKYKGRRKVMNLFRPNGPDQLWKTDITYIPTESGITYLICHYGLLNKGVAGISLFKVICISRDAISSVESAVLMAFNGSVPKNLVLRTDNSPVHIARVKECHETP